MDGVTASILLAGAARRLIGVAASLGKAFRLRGGKAHQ